MTIWARPQYPRKRVDAAGAVLANQNSSDSDIAEVLPIISNWRSSHSFPLNTFQIALRKRAKRLDASSLVAQRIKRLPAIRLKLQDQPTMKLSQMSDIGGCRAVVDSVRLVNRLKSTYEASAVKHALYRTDDYIEKPKVSGYRGIHLLYKYYSDYQDLAVYDTLRIEVQLRSRLEHLWATAVEVVGAFIRQALKSSHGEERWLRFFSLMGAVMARREKTPPVPETPTTPLVLKEELREHKHTLEIVERLEGFRATLQVVKTARVRNAHFFLLVLDPKKRILKVTGFKRNDMEEAFGAYTRAEEALSPEAEAVVVGVDSLAQLRRSYPNYYLDTQAFIKILEEETA